MKIGTCKLETFQFCSLIPGYAGTAVHAPFPPTTDVVFLPRRYHERLLLDLFTTSTMYVHEHTAVGLCNWPPTIYTTGL